jgi:radical SAM protein with 4Fe4S-binding SPASM domain
MTRNLEFMDYNLFKEILDELNIINPRNGGIQIQLHQFGESTLHPQIDRFLKLCQHYRISTMISSNGASLMPKINEKLIDNLDHLWISFDSIDKETYEKMRKGAVFEKTIENIAIFMKMKGNKKPKVTISSLIEVDKEEFEKFWSQFGNFSFLFKNYHNWRHEDDIVKFTRVHKNITSNPCLYLVSSFCVLVNGDVVPCCMDYNGEEVLGNLKKQSIAEIWFGSSAYKKLRVMHLTGQKENVTLCKGCTEYPQPKVNKNGT